MNDAQPDPRPLPDEKPQTWWRRFRKRVWVAGAVAASAITVATIVIPMLADANERRTSVDTLDTGAPTEPATDPIGVGAVARVAAFDGTEFVRDSVFTSWHWGSVPVDAPWETFPTSNAESDGTCSDEQNRWLFENGVPDVQPLVSGELRNTATTGGSLSLRNLRVIGEFVDQAPPRVTFSCYVGGMGAVAPPIWTGATLGDPTPAVYIENPDPVSSDQEGLSPDLVGTPFTHNLAPGEFAQIYLVLDTLDPMADFIGRVVTDVVVGEETYEAVLTEGYLQTGPAQITSVHPFYAFEQLYCLPDAKLSADFNSGSITENEIAAYACTPAELAALVKV